MTSWAVDLSGHRAAFVDAQIRVGGIVLHMYTHACRRLRRRRRRSSRPTPSLASPRPIFSKNSSSRPYLGAMAERSAPEAKPVVRSRMVSGLHARTRVATHGIGRRRRVMLCSRTSHPHRRLPIRVARVLSGRGASDVNGQAVPASAKSASRDSRCSTAPCRQSDATRRIRRQGTMCKVLNKHHAGIPAGAIYIGRGSKWGNPFRIGTGWRSGGRHRQARAVAG